MSDDLDFVDDAFGAFSQDELAALDQHIEHAYSLNPLYSAQVVQPQHRQPSPSTDCPSGGPRISIALETPDANSSRSKPPQLPTLEIRPKESVTRSPYDEFRAFSRTLSVTDLVSPSWCELQYDYGLRQRRSSKLDRRPSSFTTKSGKEIKVAQELAAQNDRVQQRGKSIHKTLEKELRPVQVRVDVTSAEERWALRLVNMLSGLEDLVSHGFTREMPVFGLIRGQIITGIIDEIQRKPLPDPMSPSVPAPATPRKASKRVSRSKQRTPKSRGHGSKRAKRSPSPSPSRSPAQTPKKQTALTSFFSSPNTPTFTSDSPTDVEVVDLTLPDENSPTQIMFSENEVYTPLAPVPIQSDPLPTHSLHLLDTKTRRKRSLPSPADTLPARLQLMLYHRLLSPLLRFPALLPPSSLPDDGSDPFNIPNGFDFDYLWSIAKVDPRRPLSRRFAQQAGLILPSLGVSDRSNPSPAPPDPLGRPPGSEACHNGDGQGTLPSASVVTLQDLIHSWKEAVMRLGAREVDRTLTIVYRMKDAALRVDTSPDLCVTGAKNEAGEGRKTRPETREEEDVDIVSAIRASLLSATDADVELKELDEDPELAWALQASLLEYGSSTNRSDGAHGVPGVASEAAPPASADNTSSTTLVAHAPHLPGMENQPSTSHDGSDHVALKDVRIIGQKRFAMDDVELDAHVESVLDWWHGRRPPRGVSVQFCARCDSCEYREGCEWREQKAEEARRKLASRKTEA